MRTPDAFRPSPLPSPLCLLAVVALCLAAAPAASAQRAPALFAFEEPHLGTLVRIKLYAADEESARRAATAAFARVAEIDRICSDYIPDSELNRLDAAAPGVAVPVSADLHRVLEAALAIARASGGAFDPTLGHYTNLWRRAARKGVLPAADQLEALRAKTGYAHLALSPAGEAPTATLLRDGLVLDLGGIAKGFAADEALAALQSHGVTRAAIAAGGDIRAGDAPPGELGWTIPVLPPERGRENPLASLVLKNSAVSSSGDREQYVEIGGTSYSHIVDPRTGLGLTRRVTATVIAPRSILADAHATALCVLPPEEGLALVEKNTGMEALVITLDAEGKETRHSTPGFPAPRQP